MNKTTTRAVVVTVVLAIGGIVVLSNVALVAGVGTGAQSDQPTKPLVQNENLPDSPEEYLTTFQSLEGTDAFEAYSEFEVIRSQAVQDVQVGTFTPEVEQRLEYVLVLLRTFDDAALMQENESYDQALTLGDESRELTEQLRESEQGEQYAILADIALDRFYEDIAETLLSEAEVTENTETQIELLSQAARAYNEAGATEQFGQVELRADERAQELQTDFETLNETEETVASFIDACGDCDAVDSVIPAEGLSVFGLYADSQTALSAGDEGISITQTHGFDDHESALAERHETVEEYSQTLALSSTSLLLGYSSALGLIVAVITWRLMLWKRDFTEAQYGDVILMGEMLNA